MYSVDYWTVHKVIIFCAMLVIGGGLWIPVTASAWEYELQRTYRLQANFCDNEDSVQAIADLFDTYSPPIGYRALNETKGCAIQFASFIPRRILDTVTIATETSNQYTWSFVEVLIDDGTTAYLITSRTVRCGK